LCLAVIEKIKIIPRAHTNVVNCQAGGDALAVLSYPSDRGSKLGPFSRTNMWETESRGLQEVLSNFNPICGGKPLIVRKGRPLEVTFFPKIKRITFL
jgi:hypothetical protein